MRLRETPHQDRSKRGEHGEFAKECLIVDQALAKAKARIKQYLLTGKASGHQHVLLPLQEGTDLCHHILVVRLLLHRVGLTLHVHHTDHDSGSEHIGHKLEHVRGSKARDIVDEVHPDRERLPHNAWPAAIERDWQAKAP